MKKELSQAVTLFKSFREKNPVKLAKLRVTLPKVVACMGHVEAIEYRTTHGRKVTLYKHPFAAGSRPLLCVSANGRQLMLLGGRYKWTDRGIVDRDSKGREIENRKHGKVINPRKNLGWNPARTIIRGHYKLNRVVTDAEVFAEIKNLIRKQAAGTLDDRQEHLLARLEVAGAIRVKEGSKRNPKRRTDPGALSKLREIDFGQQAYRGYLIRRNAFTSEMWIEKDGQLIARVPPDKPWVWAREQIDQIA